MSPAAAGRHVPVDRRRRMDKSPACGESYWHTPGPTIPLTRQARSKSNVRTIRGENPLRKRQPRACAGPKSGNFFTSPLISFRPSQLLLCGIELRQSGRWGKCLAAHQNACLKATRGTEAPWAIRDSREAAGEAGRWRAAMPSRSAPAHGAPVRRGQGVD